jgi:PTH1 family peptidyl-tRNA hydrolase
VIHDELDLAPGVVRVKFGGGTAGHNGLRSIQSHLKNLEFARVRIGIGKPPGAMHGADYVLRRAPVNEKAALESALRIAAEAVELILERGIDVAMNDVNAR